MTPYNKSLIWSYSGDFHRQLESMDVDSELGEILKDPQETIPEGDDTSDTGTTKTTNVQSSSSEGSPKLIEEITLNKLWQSMVQTLQLFHLSQIPL